MNTSTELRFASEIKFLVPLSLAPAIREWSRSRLNPDPHAAGRNEDFYHVSSLYFETSDFRVFHRVGSFGRSKYRIRRYGRNSALFLERKLRVNSVLVKRRSRIKKEQLAVLDGATAQPWWEGDWFHRRILMRELRPRFQISYDRTARVGFSYEGPIRLTLDEAIRGARVSGTGFVPAARERLLTSAVVLELKFVHTVPALFKELIETFRLSPTHHSKYRRAVHVLEFSAVCAPEERAVALETPELNYV